MRPQLIFCPNCHTLILAQPACPNCGWERSSVIPLSGEGKELWRFDAQAKARSAPVIADQRLFFSAESGDLFALDLATQRALWTITLDEGVASESVAVWQERLFYGEVTLHEIGPYDKCLVALEARTGKELWRFDTQAMSVSSPAVSLGTVYAVSSGKVVHALDALSGKERWRKTIAMPWSPAAPLVTVSTIYIPARGNTLTALDASNGAVRWTFDTQGWVPNTPALYDDVLYVASWDSHLYALDANSGKLVWKFQADRFLISAPAVNRDIVCVGCRDRHLYIVERATGKLLQRVKVGRVYGAPLIRENVIFVGSEDRRLYAYDAQTFALLWSFDAGSKLMTALACDENAVYAVARSGALFAIQWRRQPQEITPETLEARGETEAAAIAYALRGNLPRAAALYERMERWSEAAALYREAQQLEPAATNYERARQIEPALALWRELNQPQRAAELLEREQRFGEAGPLYENLAQARADAGDAVSAKTFFAKAGAMFERARQFAKAYDLYERAGDEAACARVANELGDEGKARWLEKIGRYRDAALLLRAKDPIKAAELFVKQGGAENLKQAIALYTAQTSPELWRKARDWAEEIRDWLTIAEISTRLGEPASTARALERAAQDLELQPENVRDTDALVKLLERAAEAYRESVEPERREHCEHKIRQYRKLPQIALSVNPSADAYRQGEANTVTVLVRNIGFGPARQICLSVGGRFQTVTSGTMIEGLRENEQRVVEVNVRPIDRGPRVPLQVLADYRARQGLAFQAIATINLPVQPPPQKREEIYYVSGDLIRDEARKITPQGDYVEGIKTGDIGYVGSFGEKRGRGRKETCPKCGARVEREWQFCANCQTVLERDEPRGSS